MFFGQEGWGGVGVVEFFGFASKENSLRKEAN